MQQIKKGIKTIGTVVDGTFHKTVKKSKHFMIKHNGWGLDKNLVIEALPPETKIKIQEIENGILYESTIGDYHKNGIVEYSSKWGDQVFLDANLFKQTKIQ